MTFGLLFFCCPLLFRNQKSLTFNLFYLQDMHDKEKEILENEAKSKIENRKTALEKYQQVINK